MLPVRIHAVWFSATGTTKKAVTRIARRLADALDAAYEEYDYTLPAARQQVQDVDADIREGGRIDLHCTVSGDNDLLALSFAYDDNWVVTVNGEEVQPSALFGGLLGVSLPQGDCTVTLRHTHPGVVPGAAASLAALAAALGWMARERKKKIGKPQT